MILYEFVYVKGSRLNYVFMPKSFLVEKMYYKLFSNIVHGENLTYGSVALSSL